MLVIVSLPEGTSSRSNMIQVSNRGKKRGCPWAGLSTVVHLMMLVRQLDLACCKTGDNLNLMAPYGTDPEEHQVLFKKSQPRILNTPNTRVLLCSFIPASTVVSGGCLIWTREGITNTTVHAQIDDQTVYSLSIHRPGKVILCCAIPFSGWWKTDGRCHSTKLILSSKSIKFSIAWSYNVICKTLLWWVKTSKAQCPTFCLSKNTHFCWENLRHPCDKAQYRRPSRSTVRECLPV